MEENILKRILIKERNGEKEGKNGGNLTLKIASGEGDEKGVPWKINSLNFKFY